MTVTAIVPGVQVLSLSVVSVWLLPRNPFIVTTVPPRPPSVKVTEPGLAVLKEVISRPPYDGAKDYFYISDVDDREYLTSLIKVTITALPKPKAKKNPLM